MPKRMDQFLVLGLALGLAVAVHTTANAGIDKSTVEAGRVHINGKLDASHDLVVRIDRADKPIEWRSSRTGGGDFEVIVEASDKIRLEGSKTGHGFVVTTKVLTSSDVNYVHCAGDLAGTFAIRREEDFVTKDGVLTFADATLKDGKKLPVSLRLALKQELDQLQGDWRVVSSQVGDEKALEEEFKKRRITITGDKLIYEHGNEQNEKKEGTIKLDPKTKAFDWTLTYPEAVGTMLGIYELNGDDLKIGFGNDSQVQVRPTRFVIGKEDVVFLLVLKRNAKDKVPEDKEKEAEDKTVDFINKVVWLLVLKGSAFDQVPEGKVKAPEDKEKAPEDKAVEAITALGGTITRDDTAAGKPVIAVSFEHTGITNEGLNVLKELKHLQSLNLHRCYRVTDAALPEIAKLKSLTSLDLGFTGLQTDTAINEGHLGESIFVTLVFRMGLGIPRRDCTGITNQGLTHLKQLEHLQSLNLNGTQITDAGLAELKTLKTLQSLVIGYNEKITGTGLAEFKDLKNLQHLDLIHSDITDEGAKCLAQLQSLKTIDLRGSKITDAGLKELQSLHNLTELNLCLVPGGPFDVTREGINELRAALPEAKILR